MGRKVRLTVDYFPHQCAHKMTMFIIEDKFQNDGFALWFKLLESLGSAQGHYIDYNKPANMQFLASKAHVSEERAVTILDTLASLEAIDNSLWANKVAWCQNFVDGLEDVYKHRRCPPPTKPEFIGTKDKYIIYQPLLSNGNENCDQINDDNLTNIGEDIPENTLSKDIQPKQGEKVEEVKYSRGSKVKKSRVYASKNGKVEYFPSVFLKTVEYDELIKRFGKEGTDRRLNKLSLYIGSKGKQYKSHYFTILNWEQMNQDKSKPDRPTDHAGMKTI
jgi:hypothetical protein